MFVKSTACGQSGTKFTGDDSLPTSDSDDKSSDQWNPEYDMRSWEERMDKTGWVYADNFPLKTGTFELAFDEEGRVSLFNKLLETGELLNTNNPGFGFYIKDIFDLSAESIRLDTIFFRGDRLVVASKSGDREVTLSVREMDKYLAFRIEEIKGIGQGDDFSLHFELGTRPGVKIMALDYMTEVRSSGSGVEVDWFHIWNRHPSNPFGGFALYYKTDDEDEDDTIIKIWVDEQLPHPKFKGEWNYDIAVEWVEEWQRRYSDRSRLILDAKNLDELYEGAEYAIRAGVSEIYLHTNVWRHEYWPKQNTHTHINESVFPNGIEDLREYSDYLKNNDINLGVHYLSGGIGFYDPKYITDTNVDKRLSSWGSGELLESLDNRRGTIKFKPDPGVQMPYNISRDILFRVRTKLPALEPHFGYNIFRIGDELVRVEYFADTDKPIWELRGVERGLYNTRRSSYEAGTRLDGLITTYGQNLIPGNDTSLLEEMAVQYAELLNKGGIARVEYDGAEIHMQDGRKWGFEKYASLVYRNLEHPVIAHSSHGRPPESHIEYKLNSTLKLIKEVSRGDINRGGAPLALAHTGRVATTLLDTHFMLSQNAAHGLTFYGLLKPEPMFGISIETLRSHGLAEEVLDALKNWITLSKYLSVEQRNVIGNSLRHTSKPLSQAGNHPESDVVHVLRRVNDQWAIVPVRVLTRSEGDVKWQLGQEHGPVSPRQYIKPGDVLKLENQYKAQPVKFIMRVMSEMDYDGSGNINIQPQASSIQNKNDLEITQDESAIVISANNTGGEKWRESDFPYWNQSVDMSNNRGIGMWVTGDGSGAILTFQIGSGDYVVPIDFEGKRYIEIPNAEVAWSNGNWGWRFGAKRTNYRSAKLSIGFGKLPANTNVEIKVEGLKALRETSSGLVNPIINVGNGKLMVTGTVSSEEYLVYEGGNTAFVYDENWNKLRELAVQADNYTMETGWFNIHIKNSGQGVQPWLEVQFMTEGEPMFIDETTIEDNGSSSSNLAYGKSYEASSEFGTGVVENAFNGDYFIPWTPWTTNNPNMDEWAVVDFREEVTFNKVTIYEGNYWDGDWKRWLHTFVVQYYDGQDWIDIEDTYTENFNPPEYDGDIYNIHDFEFDSVTTTRMRLYIHQAIGGMDIREIQVSFLP